MTSISSRETRRKSAVSHITHIKYLSKRRKMLQDPNDPENHLIGPYLFNSSIVCFNASLIPKQPTNSNSLLHIPLGIPNTKLSITFACKSEYFSPIPFGSDEISDRMSRIRRSGTNVPGAGASLEHFVLIRIF